MPSLPNAFVERVSQAPTDTIAPSPGASGGFGVVPPGVQGFPGTEGTGLESPTPSPGLWHRLIRSDNKPASGRVLQLGERQLKDLEVWVPRSATRETHLCRMGSKAGKRRYTVHIQQTSISQGSCGIEL